MAGPGILFIWRSGASLLRSPQLRNLADDAAAFVGRIASYIRPGAALLTGGASEVVIATTRFASLGIKRGWVKMALRSNARQFARTMRVNPLVNKKQLAFAFESPNALLAAAGYNGTTWGAIFAASNVAGVGYMTWLTVEILGGFDEDISAEERGIYVRNLLSLNAHASAWEKVQSLSGPTGAIALLPDSDFIAIGKAAKNMTAATPGFTALQTLLALGRESTEEAVPTFNVFLDGTTDQAPPDGDTDGTKWEMRMDDVRILSIADRDGSNVESTTEALLPSEVIMVGLYVDLLTNQDQVWELSNEGEAVISAVRTTFEASAAFQPLSEGNSFLMREIEADANQAFGDRQAVHVVRMFRKLVDGLS